MFMKLVEPEAVYIEVSALGRPYDDQAIWRNEMETIALVMITTLIKNKKYKMYYSPVHEEEISRNSEEAEKAEILRFLHEYGINAAAELDYESVERRAFELVEQGFGYADALHAANAEALGAAFITCDDGLLKKCRHGAIRVWYGTTIDFCTREGLL